VLEAPITPPAASIARIDLDAALWNAAIAAGVDARQLQTVQSVTGDGPFTVSSSETFAGRSVIDASGRWSNLSAARHGMSSGSGAKWVGLKAHFVEPRRVPSVDLYFFEGGYCGVQPLGASDDKYRINACAMVRSDVASALSQVLQRHPVLWDRSKKWTQASEPVSTSPLIFRRPEAVRDRILLAGDAAGFVDPFVGDGISLALQSGVMAADSLQDFFAKKVALDEACQSYRQNYERRLMPVFRNSSRIRRLFFLPAYVRVPLARLFQYTPALTRYLVQKTR
jgi:flavin-dependent dehydrogenase